MPDSAAGDAMRGWILGLTLVGLASSAGAETAVERGRYLVETIAGCGNCHTPMGPNGPDRARNLAGGLVIVDDETMRAVARNITPDRETGIGGWSDAAIVRAIREGVRPDGRVLGPPMPFTLYRDLADEDVAAIVAYLRTVPPVRNEVERSTYNIPLPPAWGPPVTTVAAPPRTDQVAYGAYLAGPVGHCVECHSPPDERGQPQTATRRGWGGFAFPGPWGVSVSADITPTGLGDWTDEEIVRAVTQGIGRDSRPLLPPMGFSYYAGMTAEDLEALVAYLRTLPPSGG